MEKLLFDSWETLLRVFILTVSGYFLLLLMLRVAGKRTVSKMNEFDFIVSVAVGSLLASLILGKDKPLADGLLALFLLILFQFILSWVSVRNKKIRMMVTGTPRLLAFKGVLLENEMKLERITKDDILAAIRHKGLRNISDADAVVMESSGELSVMIFSEDSDDALSDVKADIL
ncbi:MAG: DUF421 domain-containing protein [Flavobacterium sp.]|nr:DUF421 domain-containing protein [Flavobacterium sp.]